MKKLLAVLCFVPVGVVLLAAIGALLAMVVKLIHLLLTNPLSFLISMGLVAGMMLAFAALPMVSLYSSNSVRDCGGGNERD